MKRYKNFPKSPGNKPKQTDLSSKISYTLGKEKTDPPVGTGGSGNEKKVHGSTWETTLGNGKRSEGANKRLKSQYCGVGLKAKNISRCGGGEKLQKKEKHEGKIVNRTKMGLIPSSMVRANCRI